MFYITMIARGYNNVMLDVCESYGEAVGIKAMFDTMFTSNDMVIVIEECDDEYVCDTE